VALDPAAVRTEAGTDRDQLIAWRRAVPRSAARSRRQYAAESRRAIEGEPAVGVERGTTAGRCRHPREREVDRAVELGGDPAEGLRRPCVLGVVRRAKGIEPLDVHWIDRPAEPAGRLDHRPGERRVHEAAQQEQHLAPGRAGSLSPRRQPRRCPRTARRLEERRLATSTGRTTGDWHASFAPASATSARWLHRRRPRRRAWSSRKAAPRRWRAPASSARDQLQSLSRSRREPVNAMIAIRSPAPS
jgi:hypothetical protein